MMHSVEAYRDDRASRFISKAPKAGALVEIAAKGGSTMRGRVKRYQTNREGYVWVLLDVIDGFSSEHWALVQADEQGVIGTYSIREVAE